MSTFFGHFKNNLVRKKPSMRLRSYWPHGTTPGYWSVSYDERVIVKDDGTFQRCSNGNSTSSYDMLGNPHQTALYAQEIDVIDQGKWCVTNIFALNIFASLCDDEILASLIAKSYCSSIIFSFELSIDLLDLIDTQMELQQKGRSVWFIGQRPIFSATISLSVSVCFARKHTIASCLACQSKWTCQIPDWRDYRLKISKNFLLCFQSNLIIVQLSGSFAYFVFFFKVLLRFDPFKLTNLEIMAERR